MKFEGRLQGREITPRDARIDVKYDAQVRFGSAAIDAMILNVSSKGFRLHAAEELEPGMDVTLEVEKLETVRGHIRWTCGPDYGRAFICVEDGEPDMNDIACVSFIKARGFAEWYRYAMKQRGYSAGGTRS